MPLEILVAPDKFKGTLSAYEAASAIARGWRRRRREDKLHLLPITDGGDGFGEVMSGLSPAQPQRTRTVDAAHRPCRAKWWWAPGEKLALLESATVIGLAKLPPGRFHPFELDTWGLGAVMRAAVAKGARHCLIGIGGSATNDGGFGFAHALGWEFYDAGGNRLTKWIELDRLARLKAPAAPRLFQGLSVAVDVGNPLLGLRGASRVYGPQKGLKPGDMAQAERCLKRLAKVGARTLGFDAAPEPSAGAAGGLGFGLRMFARGQLRPGFDLFAKRAHLDARLRAVDLVITGEGALDRSTAMGKGAGSLAARCRELKVPCVALAGTVAPSAAVRAFNRVFALTELTSVNQAKQRAGWWLERLAARAAAEWDRMGPGSDH